MKLLQFLKEDNGTFSSTRLVNFMIIVSSIIDWQHAVWTLGSWHPDWTTVSLIAGSLGFKVLQKRFETKS